MRWIERPPGVLIEGLGEGWVAFSPLTGGSHLLNSEGVALLETLQEGQAVAEHVVVERLAAEFGVSAAQVAEAAAGSWSRLQAAGLIRIASRPAAEPA